MAAYADFTYYQDVFLGTAIAESAFPQLALRASAKIDQVTFDRAAPVITANTDAALVDKIQMATCAIAEDLQIIANGEGVGIQEESTGNHSVKYAAGSIKTLTPDERLEDTAREYLGNTGLMFRGV